MDDTWMSIILFIFMIFLYFHVQNQYKTSEFLEIYETDFMSNQELQNTLNLKQPVLFTLSDDYGILDKDIVHAHETIVIRDTRENIDSIVLNSESALGLIQSDTNGHYFSDNNVFLTSHEYIQQKCQMLDPFLQPHYCVRTTYDVLFGSRKSYTPMVYHIHSQRFLVIQGNSKNSGIRIKMCPWKNTPLLNPIQNYEQFEFYSRMNMFSSKDQYNFKILDFVVNPGYILFIPPYWWYSIQYLDTSTCVTSITYSTAMNCISNVKEYAMYLYHQSLATLILPKMDVPTPGGVDVQSGQHETDVKQEKPDSLEKDISLTLIDDLKKCS
jgi:hypothetical protein